MKNAAFRPGRSWGRLPFKEGKCCSTIVFYPAGTGKENDRYWLIGYDEDWDNVSTDT